MTEKLYAEIGFDANTNDTFVKWYDVTPYLLSGKTKLGRNYELDRIEAGTGSFEFDNPDGRFTPGRKTLSVLAEQFNAFGSTGPDTFTVDSGEWQYGGSGVTGQSVTSAPTGVVATGTLAPGGFLSVEYGAGSAPIPVKQGDTLTVSYRVRAADAVGVANVPARSYVVWGNDSNPSTSTTVSATAVTSSTNDFVKYTETYTVPGGVTRARPGVRAEQKTGLVSLTLGFVKASLPSPYAGKVETGKPIRAYLVCDDNWLHHESVNASLGDVEGPRWHNQGGPTSTGVTEVFDVSLGRDVFEFNRATGTSYAWYPGLKEESDYVPVKTGQSIKVTASVTNVSVGQTGPTAGVGIEFAAAGTDVFARKVTGTPSVSIGTYSTVDATWVATGDGYVRAVLACTVTAGATKCRAADLKLTIDNGTSSTVGPLSGRFPIFRGTIERWVQEYHGKLSTVSVESIDGMGSFSKPIKTPYRSAVNAWYRSNVKGTAAEGQFFYWPCVEKERTGSTVPDIGPHNLNVYPGTLPGGSTQGFTDTKTMIYSDGAESGGYTVHVDEAAVGSWAGAALSLTAGYNPPLPQWSTSLDVDCWFLPEALPPPPGQGLLAGYPLFQASTAPGQQGGPVGVTVYSDGDLRYQYSLTDNNLVFVAGANTVVPGVLMHLGMRVTIDPVAKTCALSAYLNGSLLGTITDTVKTQSRPEIPRFDRVTFAQDVGIYGGSNGGRTFDKPMRGTLNHVMLAFGVPSGFHGAAHTAGSDLSDSETARLGRVLDAAGWTGGRRFDAPLSTLVPARWAADDDGGTVLAEAAESAGGTVYVGPSGAVVYHNRHRRINSPVRWVVREWADGLRFQVDDSRIKNEVKAERSSGMFRTARDVPSIDKHGRKPLTVKRDVVSDLEVADAAAWALRRYKDPVPWCDTLQIAAHTLTGDSDQTLKALAYGASLSDRLQMVDLPPTAPADECDFFIEGIETDFAVDGGLLQWTRTLSVSDVGNSMAWVIEDEATGLLDSDFCILVY